MLGEGQVRGLLQRRELDRPDRSRDGLVGCLVALALPEGVNDVFDTDDALLTEELFDDNIVGDGKSLFILASEVASLSDHLVKNLL